MCGREAVVGAVMRAYGLRREEIILLGQSIGSGPTCHLASKCEQQFGESFGAVVLVSPLLSALSVVSAQNAWCTPAKVFKRMDVYKNYQVVKNIKCPILLIHGRQGRRRARVARCGALGTRSEECETR